MIIHLVVVANEIDSLDTGLYLHDDTRMILFEIIVLLVVDYLITQPITILLLVDEKVIERYEHMPQSQDDMIIQPKGIMSLSFDETLIMLKDTILLWSDEKEIGQLDIIRLLVGDI